VTTKPSAFASRDYRVFFTSRVLSALVGKGTITQNQADAINQALTSDRSAQQAIRTADQTAIENVVATTLGIDAATIKSRMAAGETLAAIAGTKTDALIAWLQANAVKPGQTPIGEVKQGEYTGRQLINE
jgi:hypothetical protein